MAFKVKFRTLFPALVTAASPLTLVKTGLAYAFGINISALRTSLDPVYITTGQTQGTATNDNAAAGKVGEYIESAVAFGSAISITTNTPKTVTSISLTPGDWDVSVVGSFVPAASTVVTQFVSSISGTDNALNTTVGRLGVMTLPNTTFPGGVQAQVALPSYRISLAVTTTIYLVVQSTFTTSTNAAFGLIRARRVR